GPHPHRARCGGGHHAGGWIATNGGMELPGRRRMSVTTLAASYELTPPVARHSRQFDGVRIGPHVVAADAPALVVAEIGINHNGDLDMAMRLVDAAAAAGDGCEYQLLRVPTLQHH